MLWCGQITAGETLHLMVIIIMLIATWQWLLPSNQLLITLIHKHVGEMNLSVMKSNHNKPSVLRRCSPGNRPVTRALVRDPAAAGGCQRSCPTSLKGNRSCSTTDLIPRLPARLGIRKRKSDGEVATMQYPAKYRSLSQLGSFRIGCHFWLSVSFITTLCTRTNNKVG